MKGIVIEEAAFSKFTLNNARLSQMTVTEPAFERLILMVSPSA
jgi:hypothetical protein